MPNRLINEASPYLRQHAHNPVDWFPWGDEALQKAKQEDKPIFLSIGYAACHWCHVMAHESFEDPKIAQILNRYFVPVKVDREERPDLDAIYIQAVQMLTGTGGWPLSVFLTPDGKPFFGGTYFPPVPRHGLPSFKDVLLKVIEAWQTQREEIQRGSGRITEALQRQVAPSRFHDELSQHSLRLARDRLISQFHSTYGGWGVPRFPQPMVLEFLLNRYVSKGDGQALSVVLKSLEAMARGGIYDQLGGGFHRYAVDEAWVVPHFEKMLYDNAQLARVYLHAWAVTGNNYLKDIVTETIDYVLREMRDPQGGFYSSQDADSEGEEGKYYVWESKEVNSVLGPEASRFSSLYGITPQGNFQGKNVLTFKGDWEDRASVLPLKEALFRKKQERIEPLKDKKVLVSWNGLMLAAVAEAGRIFDNTHYKEKAKENAEFLLTYLRKPNGRLWHFWYDGVAKGEGLLDDYTNLIQGLLELYFATFEPQWFEAAYELLQQVLEHFSAKVGFYDTPDDYESLVIRPRNLYDNATPSANSTASLVLIKLSALAQRPSLRDMARESLKEIQDLFPQYPLAFGQWLSALDLELEDPHEIAIVGDPRWPKTQELLQTLPLYRPYHIIAVGMPQSPVPMLKERPIKGDTPVAYVCKGSVCQAPVSTAQELKRLLSM